MDKDSLDTKFGLPRFGPPPARVMFKKWKEYFPDGLGGDDDDDDDDDVWQEDDGMQNGIIVAHQMQSPFGTSNLPDINKLFNFYVCSTNFAITTKMYQELNNNVEGVETLDKISPYKIRIGIGELFDEQEVKNSIKYKLKECLDKQR